MLLWLELLAGEFLAGAVASFVIVGNLAERGSKWRRAGLYDRDAYELNAELDEHPPLAGHEAYHPPGGTRVVCPVCRRNADRGFVLRPHRRYHTGRW